MKQKLKSRNVVDTITHYLPTLILGIAAIFGLDQSQANALVQSVGSIVGGILTIAPIVVHVFRNFQADKYEKELSVGTVSSYVSGTVDRFDDLVKGYQKNSQQIDELKKNTDAQYSSILENLAEASHQIDQVKKLGTQISEIKEMLSAFGASAKTTDVAKEFTSVVDQINNKTEK